MWRSKPEQRMNDRKETFIGLQEGKEGREGEERKKKVWCLSSAILNNKALAKFLSGRDIGSSGVEDAAATGIT